ncbi:hypothetical protein EBX31_00245 [bacterium]|nr:hypothetical protein [bacterium]
MDGDHSCDAVMIDMRKTLELWPGGVLLWHDSAGKYPGAVRWVGKFAQEHPLFCLRKTCLAVWMDGVDARRAELSPIDPSLEEKEFSTVAKIR